MLQKQIATINYQKKLSAFESKADMQLFHSKLFTNIYPAF